MNYFYIADKTVESLDSVRAKYPNMSIPDGADLSGIGYLKFEATPEPTGFNKNTHGVRQAAAVLVNGVMEQRWEVFALDESQSAAMLDIAKNTTWESIKRERDRRKYLGVKVGAHWFHSDDPSRIQQLALAMMGAAIPAGLMWKTLTLSPPPVFVEMTPALAQGIFQATAANDAAVFAAAEAHRIAMEASSTPEAYDYSGGWPASIADAA